MIIEIIKTNGIDAFPKIGEVYYAKRYSHDPFEKITLYYQVDSKSHKKIKAQYGTEPLCNEYLVNVKILEP